MDGAFRAIIVDDHPLYREGLVWTLGERGGIRVLGEGESAEEALRLVDEYCPDVAILDIAMPGNGINAAGAICKAFPNVKIIMLTVSEKPSDITEALKNGAHGYLLKGVRGAELVDTVQSIVSGRTSISRSLASHLLSLRKLPKRDNTSGADIETPTEQEGEILTLVADGKTNEEIGELLAIHEQTVVNCIVSARRKYLAQAG